MTVNILTGKEIRNILNKKFSKDNQIIICATKRKSQEQLAKFKIKNKFQLFVNPTTFDLFSQLELDRRENG